MTTKKNNSSTIKATENATGQIWYLCNRDEENGLDTYLDMNGYTIEAL